MTVTFAKPDVETLRKKYMVVDMHFHTRYSHDCSTSIKSLIARAKKLGVYVAVTDHNEIRGVLEAEKIEPGRIKPGVEITTKEGKDILIYFYTVKDLEQFFTTHITPYIKNKVSLRGGKTGVGMAQLFKALKQYQCVVALAHPFAVGVRMSYKYFRNGGCHFMQNIHAIEVVNQALPHRRNLATIGWAIQCKKTMIGGTDGHIVGMLGSAFTLAEVNSWDEFLRAIKRNDVSVIGEEQMLHQQVANMARILHEKTKVLENRRIKNGY